MAEDQGILRGIVSRITRAALAAAGSVIVPLANKLSATMKETESITTEMSKYSDEQRIPTYDEVIKTHTPGFIEDTTGISRKLYDSIALKPVQAWTNFLFNPSQLTPEEAAAQAKTLIPLGLGATIAAGALDGAVEVGTLGQVEFLRDLDAKIWARMGLGIATASAIQSPVRIGLFQNLDYYYQKAYRSTKPDAKQLYDGVKFRELVGPEVWEAAEAAYATPKPVADMTPEEIETWASKAAEAGNRINQQNFDTFKEAMSWHGFRDEDMELLDRSAKLAPSAMMLRQMAQRGFFDPTFMARATMKGGYDDWAIQPMLNFYAYMAQEGTWAGYRAASESAFSQGLMSEEDFRRILTRIHVPDILIEAIVATQKLRGQTDTKALTTTQILNSYTKNIITREEAAQNLKDIGFSETDAETLILAKESQQSPAGKMPTLAQYNSALRQGIISPEEYLANLQQRGYTPQYADLLLKIETAKQPTTKTKLTMTNLGQAYRQGIISQEEMTNKLTNAGYTNQEANMILTIYQSQNKIPTAQLTKAEILKAWNTRIIDTNEALDRLTQMGYPLEDIEILFQLNIPKTAS